MALSICKHLMLSSSISMRACSVSRFLSMEILKKQTLNITVSLFGRLLVICAAGWKVSTSCLGEYADTLFVTTVLLYMFSAHSFYIVPT